LKVSTIDSTAPSVPTNLLASSITKTSVVLTWTASTDNVAVKNYELLRNNTKIADVIGTSYTVTGLLAGTKYTFNVRAKDAAGNTSLASTTREVTTLIEPNPPTNIVFTAATSKLTWTASTGATGYKVYVNKTLITTLSSVTSYTLNTTKWVKGQAYLVQLLALNKAGDGKLSAEVKAVIPKDLILVVAKKVYINGKLLPSTVQPMTVGGRTFVPFKAIFEPFGVTASWNNTTKTLTGTKTGFSLKLTINNKTAIVNGKTVTLDVAPTIINGSTYVPLRFVGESLGVNVEYRPS
jgi:hypothetical protein